MKNSFGKGLFIFLSGVIIFFLLFPILKLFYSNGLTNILQTLKDKEVIDSILLTFKVSLFATIFVFFTGVPLAYLIARNNFFGKSVVEAIIDLPTMIPHTAAGIAILLAFNSGFLKLQLIDSEIGIIFAMMFLSAPYLINGAKEGFKKVDVKYEYVARTLGANWFSAFLRVVLPNARRDIVNGMLMMWARGLGEFGAVVIIAYHPMVAPVLIYDRFNNFGLKYSAPVAAAMILLSIMIFLIIRYLNNKKFHN
ncbi:sulfate/molybdate ABC transporter, permease [Deferribacter desulfuricans SSM1]|uniref:Sulfate/molybdate ABC transporter, permease n=1 Tax=Deferribacter desulfuricans (strain DSM 14783 / JCM 11476 / NBRC 101012 / SSM1) TaxID=639282 RepID=D3PA84_DEFDS|nr:ABC transporter permease [Deferribacter desulfuricans]BAI81624.1 sulfate/molybdate ABC transporter, permease [Deferribacter desulfuricans SSM1]